VVFPLRHVGRWCFAIDRSGRRKYSWPSVAEGATEERASQNGPSASWSEEPMVPRNAIAGRGLQCCSERLSAALGVVLKCGPTTLLFQVVSCDLSKSTSSDGQSVQ
jgi:hypothetical protein